MLAYRNISFVIFAVVIFMLFLLNIRFGSVDLSWTEVINSLFFSNSESGHGEVIILQYRLPQAITSISVGIGLSLAGMLLQTTFGNPLAGPSVLGISAGSSLGVALLVLMGGITGVSMGSNSIFFGDFGIVVAAFIGALAVLLIIIFVSGRIGNAVTVLIIGIMIGYLVSAVVGTLQFFSSSEDLHSFILWGLGSFSNTNISQSLTILILTLLISLTTLFFIKPLNALLLGYRYAVSSGFNVKILQTVFILFSGLLIALGTAFTGPIAFIGLAVPHIARSYFRTSNHSVLIPAVILFGAGFSLLCNLISKLPGYDASLPINAVTSIIGAPIVIWVIIKGRRLDIG
ncbi:MAG: iron ABC transporter permease [Lentimicrobiaceae bacterium]|jgi:iron complex transport system permease protein|nr:iron ABC transporter permease [Lentimicrobiaceae bacterium]MBT3455284.1 iron ABC transporter permease [Lentimicrobiaceae bacterium]MBT3817716.1 iron ABC transporter permease [Lentimicrobiaceae bacterium]MBT4190096.1 iron ABC transporter permease [Lentimicrobiaceae bacterium]MBT4468256.1 iron ABC transporter permease [Lentimicrobiaceae bacterium]